MTGIDNGDEHFSTLLLVLAIEMGRAVFNDDQCMCTALTHPFAFLERRLDLDKGRRCGRWT